LFNYCCFSKNPLHLALFFSIFSLVIIVLVNRYE